MFFGYVPLSFVSYEDWEIKDLNKNAPTDRWETLPSFVMDIQGINRKLEDGTEVLAPERLLDIDSSLDFSIGLSRKDPRHKLYYRQVFEVFSKIKFYRIEAFSKEEVMAEMKSAMKYFERFIPAEATHAINYAFSQFNHKATKNYRHLLNLFNTFSEMDMPFPVGEFFVWASEQDLEYAAQTRILAAIS